jgi:hypothetical protein
MKSFPTSEQEARGNVRKSCCLLVRRCAKFDPAPSQDLPTWPIDMLEPVLPTCISRDTAVHDPKLYNLSLSTFSSTPERLARLQKTKDEILISPFKNTRPKKERTLPVDNTDGTEMATSDTPYTSENPNEVTVSEEKFPFTKGSLVKDIVPHEVKIQKEQGGSSKIGTSPEEWSGLRKNMLGAQDKRSIARHLRRKAKQGAFGNNV